jgi:hypothetical protein
MIPIIRRVLSRDRISPEQPNNACFPQPFSVNLISSHSTTTAGGTMHIKVGFVHPPNSTNPPSFEETYKSLIRRSRPSLVSAPPVRLSVLSECHVTYGMYHRPEASVQSVLTRAGRSTKMTVSTLTRRKVKNAMPKTTRTIPRQPSPHSQLLPTWQRAPHLLLSQPSQPPLLGGKGWEFSADGKGRRAIRMSSMQKRTLWALSCSRLIVQPTSHGCETVSRPCPSSL